MSRIAGTLHLARAIEAAQVTARLLFSPASLCGGRAALQRRADRQRAVRLDAA